jgi:hypothetical protein
MERARAQRIAALRSQLALLEAKVAELPPGFLAAFAKEQAEASVSLSRHDEVDGDRDELDDALDECDSHSADYLDVSACDAVCGFCGRCIYEATCD